jgi:hypothetical protein
MRSGSRGNQVQVTSLNHPFPESILRPGRPDSPNSITTRLNNSNHLITLAPLPTRLLPLFFFPFLLLPPSHALNPSFTDLRPVTPGMPHQSHQTDLCNELQTTTRVSIR